jgi:hypothetical protein
MLASTLLVTIRGPFKMVDMELPGDVPVSELVPVLLEICASCEDNPQALHQADARLQVAGLPVPLSLGETLVEAGVCDGTILVLQTNDSRSPLDERLMPQQFTPRRVQPGVETGGIGVSWEVLV